MTDPFRGDADSPCGDSRSLKRNTRVTIALGNGQSVTVTGCGPTVEGLLATLEEAAQRVRKGRQLKVSLKTLQAMWKDQRVR